jgi:hypothetical protein
MAFGQNGFWPKRLLAKMAFGQNGFWPKRLLAKTAFGQNGFWPKRLRRSGPHRPRAGCAPQRARSWRRRARVRGGGALRHWSRWRGGGGGGALPGCWSRSSRPLWTARAAPPARERYVQRLRARGPSSVRARLPLSHLWGRGVREEPRRRGERAGIGAIQRGRGRCGGRGAPLEPLPEGRSRQSGCARATRRSRLRRSRLRRSRAPLRRPTVPSPAALEPFSAEAAQEPRGAGAARLPLSHLRGACAAPPRVCRWSHWRARWSRWRAAPRARPAPRAPTPPRPPRARARAARAPPLPSAAGGRAARSGSGGARTHTYTRSC